MHLRPRFDQEKSANSASLPRNSSHGGPAPRQSVSLSSAAGTESTRPGIAGRRFGSAPQPFLLELPFQGASNGRRISRGGATRSAWLAPGYSWSPLQGCRNGYIISPRRGWPSEPPCRGSPPWLPIRFERGHVVAPGTAWRRVRISAAGPRTHAWSWTCPSAAPSRWGGPQRPARPFETWLRR